MICECCNSELDIENIIHDRVDVSLEDIIRNKIDEYFDKNTYKDDLYPRLKKTLDRMESIEKTLQSQSVGVQNVYSEFELLKKSQKEFFDFFNSDLVKKVLKKIPSEEYIQALLNKIENGNIGKLNSHLDKIKDDLDNLCSLFGI